jgi:predicted RNA binding protein YcfA (HicA-like mRNA interferase family)
MHSGANIKRKTLRSIVEDLGLTIDEFTELV